LSEDEQLRRAREFRERMTRRRSVRHFSADPVPLELIEDAVRTAASAPSGANQQPWRFVVVGDPDLKRQIRIAAEAEERENYARRFPQEWLAALEPFGTNWQKPFLEIAPWLIVVFRIDYGIELEAEGDGPPVETRRKHYYVSESVGIATGFLFAALHTAGLATLAHTPSPMGFLAQILERPANERPFLLIPVGYPAPECQVPEIPKKSLADVMIMR
jgi:nitroreductase